MFTFGHLELEMVHPKCGRIFQKISQFDANHFYDDTFADNGFIVNLYFFQTIMIWYIFTATVDKKDSKVELNAFRTIDF